MKYISRFRSIRSIRLIRSILVAVLLIGLISGIFYLATKSAPITRQAADTLIKLDEGYGSTVSESVASAVSGTITGAVWRAEDLCLSGKCLFFDGAGDFINFGNDSDYNFTAGANWTISVWIRHAPKTTGTDVIVAKTNASAGYKLYMESDGDITFAIDDDATWTPDASVSSTAATYDDNNWHHIAAVKTGTTKIELYIDGVRVGQNLAVSGVGDLTNSANFYVGIDGNGSSNPFTGFIDELKIYTTTAQTQAQINADSVRGSPATGASASFAPDQSWLSNGLVGYWKMDENSWTVDCATSSVLDSSGNSEHGRSCPTTTGPAGGSPGKFGNSGDFDGSNDYIDLNGFNYLDGQSTVSVSAWIQPDFVNTDASDHFIWGVSIFVIRFNTNQDDFGVSINATGGTLNLYTQGLSWTQNTWHHIVVTYNGNTAYIYWDGVIAATGTTSGALNNSGSLDAIGNNSSNTWLGNIDEVRAYTRALTPAEVQSLYNWAPGPVGYWDFNEGTGTSTVNDRSGKAHPGTMNGLTLEDWIPGKFGSAMYFGNAGEDVTVGTAFNELDNLTGATLTAWIRPDFTTTGPSVNHTVFDSENDFSLHYAQAADVIRCSLNGTANASTTTSWNPGEWHHVSCVYDGAYMRLYWDGILQGTSASYTSPIGSDTINTRIGTDFSDTLTWLGGIDDVKVYNYTRTPTQIVEDMNAGHPAPGSPIGSALAYWKFDEGGGSTTTARDSSTNGKNLLLAGGSGCLGGCYTNNGKYGQAFDAGVDESFITDGAFGFGLDSFSFSIWIKSDTDTYPAAKETIVLRGTGGSPGYWMYFDTSGNINFEIDDDSSWTPDDSVISGANCNGQDCYDGLWHHIVAVKTGTSQIELWVDGNLVKVKNPILATNTLSGSNTLFLGEQDVTDNGNEFNGYIDETSFYTFALTGDQIKLLFNQGKSAAFGSITTSSAGTTADNSSERDMCPPGDTGSCSGPVGEWLMNENTGSITYMTRASGNITQGNDGTLTNMDTSTAWVPGMRGSAVKFDGINDYINTQDLSNTIDGVSAVTFSAWVKFNSLSNIATIVAKRQNANTGRLIMQSGSASYGGSDDVLLTVDNVSDGIADACYSTGNIITTGVWQFWTMVYNGAVGSGTGCDRIQFYLNGTRQSLTQVASSTILATTPSNGIVITIGSEASGTTGPANAAIDEVRIYNYARSQAQVQWEYNRGLPIGWWKFDECTGTNANDSSVNNYPATITIGATGSNTAAGTCGGISTDAWYNGAVGKSNASIDLDGTNDYVTVADQDIYSFGNGGTDRPFSVGLWANIDTGAAGAFVARDSTAMGAQEFRFYWETTDDLKVQLLDINGFAIGRVATNQVAFSTWKHYLFTYDGSKNSSGVKIYVNGIRSDDSDNITGSYAGISNTAAWLSFGARDTDGTPTNLLNGKIDEVKIWNYELTANQVITDYNQSSAARYGPATGSP